MPAAPAPASSPPRSKPGIGPSISEGWSVLKRHFWTLIVATLIYLAVEAVSNVFSVDVGPGSPDSPLSILSPLYSVLVTAPLLVGFAHLCLRAVRGAEPELEDLLAGFRTYVDAVGGMLLYGLAIAIGLVLLIVPGIVAMVRLAFVPYLIVDRQLGPVEAIKTSWQETSGHGWSLFGLLVVSIVIVIVGVLLFIVGVVPAIALVTLAWAVYYDRATGGELTSDPPRQDPSLTREEAVRPPPNGPSTAGPSAIAVPRGASARGRPPPLPRPASSP